MRLVRDKPRTFPFPFSPYHHGLKRLDGGKRLSFSFSFSAFSHGLMRLNGSLIKPFQALSSLRQNQSAKRKQKNLAPNPQAFSSFLHKVTENKMTMPQSYNFLKRLASSSASIAHSKPLFPDFNPARFSACSTVSVVRTP